MKTAKWFCHKVKNLVAIEFEIVISSRGPLRAWIQNLDWINAWLLQLVLHFHLFFAFCLNYCTFWLTYKLNDWLYASNDFIKENLTQLIETVFWQQVYVPNQCLFLTDAVTENFPYLINACFLTDAGIWGPLWGVSSGSRFIRVPLSTKLSGSNHKSGKLVKC